MDEEKKPAAIHTESKCVSVSTGKGEHNTTYAISHNVGI